MKPIISVEGLGKSYTIRHEGQTPYKSLREEIFKLPKRLLHKGSQSQEEFWALKDVNFDIMPGDRVGIIGRNGAGKSTLLKLLSRITEPTTGRITLRGRVASLLEVGTGFHPELTGRENIFLNGAILGMSRAEVRRKFDEIVDFAGVEKFLDTPVKRYSSGMYVRLAFAVAAHLEPEILIVDEVLAVGDIDFQKKCLGKMEGIGKEGRTVLFVSHNLSSVQQLCNRAVLLRNGLVVMDDSDVLSVISKYTNDGSAMLTAWKNTGMFQNAEVVPMEMCLKFPSGNIVDRPIEYDEEVYIEILAEIRQAPVFFDIAYSVFSEDGTQLYSNNFCELTEQSSTEYEQGLWKFRTQLLRGVLNEGRYRIEYASSLCNQKWLVPPGVGPFLTVDIKYKNKFNRYWPHGRFGLLAPYLPWEISRHEQLK
ncbi:ABC transporter ATP-binding protein [Desulfovibrio sp. MES5]|uniref:ABC transporter ATP-binding protein n=1 Tax=Desulfovibrio sp. MES5 TaxID=1899016 RepID=UPI0025BF67DD|nr:ABC transporter ATP-binding protein [Desulfovibrio sp. MES5]